MNRPTLAAALFALTFASVSTYAAERPRITERAVGPWQLFIDDYLIASRQNVTRHYHPFVKDKNNPLLVVDKPWEDNVINGCTVLPDESGEGFRMYYYCWTHRDTDPSGSYLLLATSKDGLKWEKPNLGLFEWKGKGPGSGTKDNNILPNGCPFVMRTPWETDPAKRFQAVGDMYKAYASPDGLTFNRLSENNIVSGGDTSHFYWDPNVNRFRCNVKVGGDVSGMRRRCVGFSETTDLTQFPPLRIIMAPDDIDDLWCKPGTVQRTHFYACPVLPYETMYVGMLQIYRAEEPEGFFHGPLWLELVSSRDGMHWLRQEPDTTVRSATALYSKSRQPLLDIGKYRSFDAGMVIAPPPIVVGDELWVYYTGYDELHDLLPYHSAIGLARMRKDGFASLDADEATGEIVTKPFEGVGGVMQVNYNARGGSIRVEALDTKGQVLDGYGRDDCESLTGDEIRKPVVWKSHKELPAGQGTVRLRFIMEHAQLYSFMAGDKAKAIDEPLKPMLQVLYTFEGNTEAWSDMLPADGCQYLRNLGTCVLDHKKPDPAFGKRSLIVGSEWRPWNRVEIEGTTDLGRQFTLAAMVKVKKNQLSRLFSAYRGNYPTNTSELIFDFDPRGRVIDGLRLWCKGLAVESKPLKFEDSKYHHLAVTYNDGEVNFYLDGQSAGQQWLPGGEPVKLARNLLVGEDAEMGTDEQLLGQVDDVLVIGRPLTQQEIATLAEKGAAVLFGMK